MGALSSVALEVDHVDAAQAFYDAFGVGEAVTIRASAEPTSGFRGFTLSLVCSQPGNVDAFVAAALAAGATTVKPAKKSFWGYGAVIQAPDGTLWKIATSGKKDTAPTARAYDDLVLLLGVADVKATKQFYVDQGLAVGKAFGSKYVEFDTPGSALKLALYGRRAAAKDAGVPVDGTGSHRIAVGTDLDSFTDPDGFAWQTTT